VRAEISTFFTSPYLDPVPFLGDEAKTYFTNLRTRYTLDRKKLQQAKVSGSGCDDVSKMKDEVEDMFLFLAWLDPFYKPRKTSSNLITVDSGNEASEDKFLTKTLITNLT